MPGPRSRVFVQLDELEAWLDSEGSVEDLTAGDDAPDPDGPDEPAPRSAGRDTRRTLQAALAAVAGVGLLGILAAVFLVSGDPPEPPALWQVAGDSLIVRNAAGEELWRASFPGEVDDWWYRRHREATAPLFVDLEGDGRVETLFVQKKPRDESSVLICFSHEGTERWRFVPGREVSTATRIFDDVFVAPKVKTVPARDGRRMVVVASHHFISYPSQIVVLTPEGDLVSEYWHSGHVGVREDRLGIADLDADGRSEIYAAGVNNARQQATLVVLDPETMEGASVEPDPAFQFQELPPGREIARVFFPRSSMNHYLHEYNVANHLYLTDDSITVSVLEAVSEPAGPTLLYKFRPDLSLDSLTASDTFLGVYERLRRDGALSGDWSEEKASLPQRVRILGKSRGNEPSTDEDAREEPAGSPGVAPPSVGASIHR